VESCLRLLEEQGFLDDHAFACAHVRSRIRLKVRGRARLAQELRQKGVSAEVVDRAIDEVFDDEETSEEELARDAARQWVTRQNPSFVTALVGTDPGPDRGKVRRRLHGFLSRRGFRSDAVRAGIAEAEVLVRDSVDGPAG
jgi:regulatory protein